MSRPNKSWTLMVVLSASLSLLLPGTLAGETRQPWEHKVDEIIASLSTNIDTFEYLQERLTDLSRSNENYSEQKNIWLSSALTLAAIASVCEYQRDLLTLFTDLRQANRKHFYGVRLKSLQLSVEQIAVMQEQMQINHSLISHSKEELALIPKENKVVLSSMVLLRQAIKEIESNR
ncbi:MAG: hypothetical protein AMJ54_00370 [Deltaproteobacteria bacterium SG8_13]|nr:MAG: hypothetical protein AMJ54_00370 [Deltaproteobacteria bacterium SG8_13]